MSPALFLLLLPFVIFAPAFLPGRVISGADLLLTAPPWQALGPGASPKNPLLIDVAWVHGPSLIWGAREIARGHFPLWNPWAFAGAPFFANPQTGLLFPLTWLAWVLPLPLALTLIAVLKLSAAGLAMYWCLRVFALGRAAASLGALVFMLNGPLVVWLQWPFASAMIALPLVLGATERLRARRDARAVLALALAVALSLVAGYPQTAVHGLGLAAAWTLCRLRGAAGGALRFGARIAAATTLGTALAAVQLLPFLEYLRESSALFYRSHWMPVLSLPGRTAVALLMPYYYGGPGGEVFWGEWNFNEMTTTVGLVPWVLLPVAAVAAWSRVETRFFLGAAAFAALTLWDIPGIPSLARLPLLSLITSTRIAAVWALALAALTALGLDAMGSAAAAARVRARIGLRLAFPAAAAFGFLSIAADDATLALVQTTVPVPAQYVAWLVLMTLGALAVLRALGDGRLGARRIVLLLSVQLASALPLVLGSNPVIEARWLYPTTPAIAHLQRQAAEEGGRVLLGTPRNLGMLYGLREVAGYDAITPRRVELLASPNADLGLTGNGMLTVSTGFASPVFDLLSIRWVLGPPGAPAPAPHLALDYDGAEARVWRNDRALPRAFLVGQARACVEEGLAPALLGQGAIDFRREVLIAGCEGLPPSHAPEAARVIIVADEPERVIVRAGSDTPAWLVLTDTWFPGWRVRVDGAEHRLWRANHAFRAVWLPAGTHEVEFRYEPRSLAWGLGLSALGAVLSGGLALGSWWRRLRRHTAGSGVTLCLLALAAAAASPAEANPAPAPFRLDLTPGTLQIGAPASLALEATARGEESDPVDVYVLRFPGRMIEPRFLQPGGTWADRFTPYRAGVSPSAWPKATVEWLETGPPGWTWVMAVFVRASTSPRYRENWRWEPLARRVWVEPARERRPRDLFLRLVPLGLLALACSALVLRYPRPPRLH